ncbi:MAG: hypothetical protein ACJ72S_13925 [Nitrososphaeraceae archaeon]
MEYDEEEMDDVVMPNASLRGMNTRICELAERLRDNVREHKANRSQVADNIS